MRILIHSNAPWCGTGYGVQTKLMAQGFQRLGHHVAISASYGLEGAILPWYPAAGCDEIPVFPKSPNTDYGTETAPAHAKGFNADICMTVLDAWVFNHDLFGQASVRWTPYYPVDMEPLCPPVKTQVERAYSRIVMSRYGQRLTEDAGLEADYAPHCYDATVTKPMPRTETRSIFKGDERFLVGMVAANKDPFDRKAWRRQLEGFSIFHKRHPDSAIVLQTMVNGPVNVVEVLAMFGVPESAILHQPLYQAYVGAKHEDISTVFSSIDVLLNVACGEGFGVPILEAQACGTPVIVGDWTAMSEVCRTGWLVDKKDAEKTLTALAAWNYEPKALAIADALEQAYNGHAALDREETVRRVAEYEMGAVMRAQWQPILARLEERIQGEAELPAPVQLNRAGRRAQERAKPS